VVSPKDRKYFIWDDKVVCKLREDWKIVGALVGCLPSHPMQNLLSGLPAELNIEEVQFLVKNGVYDFNIQLLGQLGDFEYSDLDEEIEKIQLKSYFWDCGFFFNTRWKIWRRLLSISW